MNSEVIAARLFRKAILSRRGWKSPHFYIAAIGCTFDYYSLSKRGPIRPNRIV